jgi:hypothetical protein
MRDRLVTSQSRLRKRAQLAPSTRHWAAPRLTMLVLSFLASCRLVIAGIADFFDAGASCATRASSAAGGEISRRRREENFRISPVAAGSGGFSGCGISTH